MTTAIVARLLGIVALEAIAVNSDGGALAQSDGQAGMWGYIFGKESNDKGVEHGTNLRGFQPLVEQPQVEQPQVEQPQVEQPQMGQPQVDKPQVMRAHFGQPQVMPANLAYPPVVPDHLWQPQVEQPQAMHGPAVPVGGPVLQSQSIADVAAQLDDPYFVNKQYMDLKLDPNLEKYYQQIYKSMGARAAAQGVGLLGADNEHKNSHRDVPANPSMVDYPMPGEWPEDATGGMHILPMPIGWTDPRDKQRVPVEQNIF